MAPTLQAAGRISTSSSVASATEKPNQPPGDMPLRVMHWGWVFGGLLLAVLLGGAVIMWLLAEATAGGPQARLRMDAIRTGLAVMAGVGAAATLLYAARRQWLNERAQRHQEQIAAVNQAHQERVQTHQERVAAADREHQERLARTTEHDASERRVTELFTSAVEHLGNDKAAVRLGGLYALERLAVEHPEHRQAIVDVVCAYLRMPYPGQDEPGPAGMEVKHEESVRQAAQQVLLRHLRSDAPSHWPGVRVDLAGARLRGFDASGCHFGEVLFHHAVFVHDAHFDGAVFDQVSRWSGTRFGGRAVFADAEWKAPVVFDEPHFGGEVVFDRARFDREMTFRSASPVEQPVSFRRATFGQAAVFDRMEFARPISFSRATFERTVSFEHTRMRADASFRGVSFNDDAMFRWASFHGCAEFESARFAGDAAFGRATFLEQVIFGPHPMGGLVRFRDCRIAGEAPRIWPAGWREKPVDDTWRTLVPDQLGDSPG